MTKLMVEHRTWWGRTRWAEYRFEEFSDARLSGDHLLVYRSNGLRVAEFRGVRSWFVAPPATCSVRVVSIEARETRAKIMAIKTVREYLMIGLKEAKELVEMPVPITITPDMEPTKAARLAADLSACGYQAEVLHAD